jgi:succinate-acetate transporter protein
VSTTETPPRVEWTDRTRVVLQPLAPPSILGLFGFAGATFIVASHIAGWYGTPTSPDYLFPFAAFFGGLAQFAAGLFAFRARDGLATAMHGMWGSFWMSYGLLYLLIAAGVVAAPAPNGPFVELGYWFIALGAITAAGAIASLAESLALFAVLGTLTAGSGLMAAALISGTSGVQTWAGWVLVVSALCAFYTASAMMLEGTFGRVILPLGKLRVAANVPGRRITEPIEYPEGMPGVRQGQ